MTASPEVPVAWTEQDERRMQWWAKDHDESRLEVRFAREIISQREEIARLRAENALLTDANDRLLAANKTLNEEIDRRGSELAATREGETPE